MSLNDPHWGRSSDEEKKNDRGDNEQRSDGVGEDGEEQNARQNPNAQDDRNPADSSADGSRRTSRDAREDDEQRDRRSQGLLSDDDLENLWSNFQQAANKIMGRQGRSNQEDLRSRLKSRDDFSRDDEPNDAAPRQKGDDYPDDGGQKRQGLFAELDRLRNQFEEDDQRQQQRRESGARNGGNGRGGNGGGLFGGGRGARAGGFSVSVLAVCAVIGWSVSGFYIVPEGQTGVVTTFGAYSKSTMPGINWHLPAPIQDVELVDVSSVRTAEIGMRGTTDRLREALMLTDDENIVDVQFNVQYRIKPETGAKDYLFNTRAPDASVTQAAESAMREVVGRKAMDSVLFESKAEIAEAVRNSMQAMLDRYSTGIEVMSVAIQNAQPPQQVQAAFNDAVKAGQDRERQINLGEAYMNAVIPKAQGTASRLKEEAEGYKARVVETARGDADRFTSVYTEYAKAPQVTRDRIYVDAMRDIYQNVTKVYVDQKSGSNLLYLPLDKIVASTQAAAKSEADSAVPASSAAAASTSAPNTAGTNSAGSATYSTDIDPREMIRSRLR
ncbi:FtsH protease activity modulator HflK [Sutterella wadsworthensis]|uniref:FtsH protease activity modulator HflK n=1 Tax=Sutterella wadsworthensis TaxID=40545 RepID=UPI0013F63DBB|nr:FtsH protease activity modulator HflK [Sutterella wadsworthensis]MBD8910780.1 FtsH protease activity modulator HflK [Sutterella wadsworthensis]